MNALKQLPWFEPETSSLGRCGACGEPVSWQTSNKTGSKYPTEVLVQDGHPVTKRNAFHKCKPEIVATYKRIQAEQAGQTSFIPGPKPVDLSGVYKLFEHAISQKLKWPKIRLQTLAGGQVALAMAGPRSKYVGQIMITDGKPYGCNQWFGRIDKGGLFQPAAQSTPEVEQLLVKLAQDPAGVAKSYGLLTGNCCFCNRRLEDERSTQVGYGPVCARHFNLPWG